jgi:hypothetical protein
VASAPTTARNSTARAEQTSALPGARRRPVSGWRITGAHHLIRRAFRPATGYAGRGPHFPGSSWRSLGETVTNRRVQPGRDEDRRRCRERGDSRLPVSRLPKRQRARDLRSRTSAPGWVVESRRKRSADVTQRFSTPAESAPARQGPLPSCPRGTTSRRPPACRCGSGSTSPRLSRACPRHAGHAGSRLRRASFDRFQCHNGYEGPRRRVG